LAEETEIQPRYGRDLFDVLDAIRRLHLQRDNRGVVAAPA